MYCKNVPIVRRSFYSYEAWANLSCARFVTYHLYNRHTWTITLMLIWYRFGNRGSDSWSNFFLCLMVVSGLMRIWTMSVWFQRDILSVVLTIENVFHFTCLCIKQLFYKDYFLLTQVQIWIIPDVKGTWHPSENKHSIDDPLWIYCHVSLAVFVISPLQ